MSNSFIKDSVQWLHIVQWSQQSCHEIAYFLPSVQIFVKCALNNQNSTQIVVLIISVLYCERIHHTVGTLNLQVIFPALDKNVAQTNLLELKVEGRLFDELMELIGSVLKNKKAFSVKEQQDIISCTEAIRTALCQHISKEEDVVRPSFHTQRKY